MNDSLVKKKQLLRNYEYYSMQDIYDRLYEQSKNGRKFTKLVELIRKEDNILLAYRNIKKNKGSVTPGTDRLNIEYIEKMGLENYVRLIQGKLDNYFPKSVRRVEIPKPNGKTRPLGIPCIDDRIIQQCIKQILEPICEAKFHNHSYGFRPNRSTTHAISRSMTLMNNAKLHYVVDIDIKGFFDNVNHSKLKKQMWNMGIQDKNLLCILGKILKSEIEGEGIPNKGTPQGGIISPLLSNIVLNELDWWISNQWETFETNHKYTKKNKYQAMKKTSLKEMFLVRYADDFKIFCKDYQTAKKIYHATTQWLQERLGLEVSKDKSKITNLKKNYTEFLGFKLMVKPKNKKYVCQSRMSDKAMQTTINNLRKQVIKIKYSNDKNEVNKLNSMILGSQMYYKTATLVSIDFNKIHYIIQKTINNRLKSCMTREPKYTKTYERLYKGYNGKIQTVNEITLYPIYAVKTKPPLNFSQNICNYTEEGREMIHNKLGGNLDMITKHLLSTQYGNESTEYNDNRISLICGQQGKCYVTGSPLHIGYMECHHKKPKSKGGTDEYKNLVWLCTNAHKLVHATEKETINKYLERLNLNEKGYKRVNTLRKLVGNSVI